MRQLGRGVASGTGTVLLGVVSAAVPTYLFLSYAARALGPEAFAPVSVLWAMVFIVGPGLFLPVQQELGRVIAGQRAVGGGGHAVGRVAVVTGSVAVLAVAATSALAGDWITERLLGGQAALLWCFEGAIAAYAVTFLARGVLTGLGSYRDVARLIAVESLARLGIAGLLAAGEPRPVAFGAAIALAPLVSVALTTRLGRRLRLPPGSPVRWRRTAAGIGWLVAASLLAQTLANAGPLAVQLLAGEGQAGEAGRFLSALVVARISLYLFQAAQATFLPNIAEMVVGGRVAELRRGVRDLLGLGLVLVLVSTTAAGLLGAPAVTLLFGSGFVVSGTTMALLTCASAVYVVAATLSQAVIASARHGLAAAGWLAGCLGFAAGATVSADLFVRVEVGYLLGSVVAATAMLACVWWGTGAGQRATSVSPGR